MEYGLRRAFVTNEWIDAMCLNPCCNGIWSQTNRRNMGQRSLPQVLILVVMEYGLRHLLAFDFFKYLLSLNPCCNGIWSQTCLLAIQCSFCLNPCCNGIWSQTITETKETI